MMHTGRREGGGAAGAFCPGPHSTYGPQKIRRYTLIEHSNTLLKQSLHIFCPEPFKFSLLPWMHNHEFKTLASITDTFDYKWKEQSAATNSG